MKKILLIILFNVPVCASLTIPERVAAFFAKIAYKEIVKKHYGKILFLTNIIIIKNMIVEYRKIFANREDRGNRNFILLAKGQETGHLERNKVVDEDSQNLENKIKEILTGNKDNDAKVILEKFKKSNQDIIPTPATFLLNVLAETAKDMGTLGGRIVYGIFKMIFPEKNN